MARWADREERLREGVRMADLQRRNGLNLVQLAERFGTTKGTVRARLREVAAAVEATTGGAALQQA